MTEKIFNVRGACFQTNSSSDHCVFIHGGLDYENINVKDYPELIIKNRTLRIPACSIDAFEEDGTVLDDVNSKIQYCVGLVAWSEMDEYVYEKAIQPIIDVLVKYIDEIDDVEFGWDRDYKRQIARKDPEDCIRAIPEVNHNSISSSHERIFESERTLLDFIFNKKSSVTLVWEGSDNCISEDLIIPIESEKSTPDATATVTIEGKEVQLTIPKFPVADFNRYTVIDKKEDPNILYTYIESLDSSEIKYLNTDTDWAARWNQSENSYTFGGFGVVDNKLALIYCKYSDWRQAEKKFWDDDLRTRKNIVNYLPKDSYKAIKIDVKVNEFNVTI